MRIDYRKRFLRQFKKLQRWQKLAVEDAIKQFRADPHNPSLRNHALKGVMKGRRSFSAAFDIRIIFEEYENYAVVIMLDVGTHEGVY